MADEVASLVLRVDSTQAKTADTALDRLVGTSVRAEKAVDELGAASVAAKAAVTSLGQATGTAATNQSAMADATRRLNVELSGDATGRWGAGMSTMAQSAAMARASIEGLNKATVNFAVRSDAFVGPTRQLQQAAAAASGLAQQQKDLANTGAAAATAAQSGASATKAFGTQAASAGMSAGQLNNALRMLPAQITDITVGLSTGQSPFTVLLQQGGQLKDMFGGIGPAFRAVGGYVAGLITPFTLAAAGAVALAVAYEKGAAEGRAFSAAIVMTGNAAGVTEGALAAMAKRISDIRGTTGNAAEVLAKLVATGKLAGESIEDLGRAAVVAQVATGRSVDDMVKDYERIADAPTEAITKLNERYHFLTLAVYDQIKALEDEGRMHDAARLALSTYAQAMEQRSAQVAQNIGLLESAWRGVTSVAKGAWDAMLGIGRDLTPQDRIGDIQKELDQIGNSMFHKERAAALRAQLTGLQDLVKWQNAAAKSEADQAGSVARGIQARKDLDSYVDSRKGTSLAASIEAENKAFKKATTEFSQESKEYQDALKAHTDRVAQIEKQFAGQKGAGTVAAGVRELEQARQQEAALRAQLESAVKITTARQDLVKFEQRIADLKAKDQLTADEKSVLSNETAIRQQLERNAGLSDQIQMQKEAVQLKTLEASAQATLAADQQRYNDQLQGFTGSPRLREQLQAQQQIYRDFQRQVSRASEQQAAGELSTQGYADRVLALKQSLDDRLAMQADYYSQLTTLESDWRNGAIGAMNDYAYEAANVAAATRSAFSNAFKGAEDALLTFVTTGKLNFSDLANSIIADLARIAIRQSITGVLANSLGTALGGMFNGGGGAPTAGQVAGATQGVNAGLPLAFSSGGYTGNKPRDEVTGVVHGQEYVLNANATARLGREALDSLNAGGPLPMSDSRSGSITPVNTGTTAQGNDAPNVQINLVNQSGEQMEAQQGGSRWDAGLSAWICDVVLTRARKDRGYRRQLQEPA